MREKLIKKLAIAGLAAIFLLSMISNSPADRGGKKPPELYKVTISINDDLNQQVPGIENWDIVIDEDGNIIYEMPTVCASPGYFYAEKASTGKNILLQIKSEGRETPGPDGEWAPLNMRVNLPGEANPIWLENCEFYHGELMPCHGETLYSPGQIWITIFKNYDGPSEYDEHGQCIGGGCNQDISMRWWLDREEVQINKKKTGGKGWIIWTPGYDDQRHDGPIVTCTNPDPPNFEENNIWETDVIGPFALMHDGKACDAPEDMYNRQVLPDFNIRLTIERVR